LLVAGQETTLLCTILPCCEIWILGHIERRDRSHQDSAKDLFSLKMFFFPWGGRDPLFLKGMMNLGCCSRNEVLQSVGTLQSHCQKLEWWRTSLASLVACSLQMWRWQWKTGTSSRSSRDKKDPVYNSNTHNQKASYAKIFVCTLWCVCLSWWSFDSDCLSFMFQFAYGKEKVFQALQIEHSCLFMNQQKNLSNLSVYMIMIFCCCVSSDMVAMCHCAGWKIILTPDTGYGGLSKSQLRRNTQISKSTRTGISFTPTNQHALVLVDVDVVAPTHSWKNIQVNWKMI
jgi:hypothetical protein